MIPTSFVDNIEAVKNEMDGREPVIFLDREHRQPISPVQVYSARGEVLRPRDIMVTAGPGATREARERIEALVT